MERSMVLISISHAIEPVGWYTTESVTHGQCDARPTVTFPAIKHQCHLASTNLYCLVTEAHVCEQLAQGHSWSKAAGTWTCDLLVASPTQGTTWNSLLHTGSSCITCQRCTSSNCHSLMLHTLLCLKGGHYALISLSYNMLLANRPNFPQTH